MLTWSRPFRLPGRSRPAAYHRFTARDSKVLCPMASRTCVLINIGSASVWRSMFIAIGIAPSVTKETRRVKSLSMKALSVHKATRVSSIVRRRAGDVCGSTAWSKSSGMISRTQSTSTCPNLPSDSILSLIHSHIKLEASSRSRNIPSGKAGASRSRSAGSRAPKASQIEQTKLENEERSPSPTDVEIACVRLASRINRFFASGSVRAGLSARTPGGM
jgi:hypothetical protein